MDAEGLRLAAHPVLDRRRGCRALRLLGHAQHTGHVLGPERSVLDVRMGPVVVQVVRSTLAAEEEHPLRDPQQRVVGGGAPDSLQAGEGDTDAYVVVALGVPPAQVGLEGRPHRVVRVQPLGSGLDAGQLAQPGEHLVGVLVAQHRAQQGLAGDVGLCDDLEGAPVDGAGQVAHEPFDQGRQDVASRLPRCAGCGRGHGCGEREDERAASGEGDVGAALFGRDPPGGEQGVGLGGVERPYGQCGEQLRPPGIQ
ncbi:MAG: hypothetical protein JF597_34580 [Streptomyces sp.]|uniref:hypothetical protein n=1 Tax=Streptomyces sp. TaxID=1931 RepID=UPI0025E7F0F4|nr:hypothetical protein [Streptomyces sp.]MBW8798520.1 hypothetical protein [Streptomyces sp.]